MAYGLIPEFVGRFAVNVTTTALSIDQLVEVLTKPQNALVKQYQALFAIDNVQFHVTRGALEAIAGIAAEQNTGARGLRTIMERFLLDTMFHVPERRDVTAVLVNEAVVRGDTEPLLITEPLGGWLEDREQDEDELEQLLEA